MSSTGARNGFSMHGRHLSHFVKALQSALLLHTPSGAHCGGLVTLLKPALCWLPIQL